MANLLGQNIGTNYKGILSLDSTINTPLDATLRAVTDGEGNASGLKLSTTDSSFSGNVGIGTDAPTASLQIQGDGINDIARFFNADPIKTVFISNRGEIGAKSEFSGDGGFVGYNGNFLTQVFALKRNSVAGLAVQSLANIGFSVNGANSVSSYEMELTDTGNLIIGGSSGTARLAVKGSGTTSSTTALLVQNSAGTNLLSVLDNGNVGIGTNTPTASIEATTFKSSSINDNGTVLQFLPSYNMYTLSQFSIGAGDMSARLGVKGYGTTSATTSLLVQNSAGTALLTIRDDGVATFGSAILANSFTGNLRTDFINTSNNAYTVLQANPANGNGKFYESVSIGTSSDPVASAKLELVSTTKGFLPPRMTTTQKNAIATPAIGLIVYDTTTNKLACYNGTTWNDLF